MTKYVRIHFALILPIIGASILTVPASADVVFTTDGSRIVGRVEQIHGGMAVITTDFLGKVEIDLGKLKSIETDETVNVQLTSGDRLVGPIKATPDRQAVAVHTTIGEVAIDLSQIASLWPKDAEDPAAVALRAEMEAEQEKLRPKWTATLEAGAVMKEGNSDTLDANGRFDVKRKTPDDLLEFFLAAEYSEQNDIRTKNEYRGGVRYESQIDERRYWYTRMELEFDEFENLDLRATAAAGFGRYWFKEAATELKTSLGLGYRHEAFDNGDTTDAGVIDVGLNYRADIAPWAQFTHAMLYTPDFEDFDAYRLDLDTALVFPLKKENWKLKVGMRNEYNSTPQRGIDRLDNTYYANVVVDFH